MSMLAAATQPTTSQIVIELLIIALVLLPGLVLLWWTRSYRPSTAVGLLRVPTNAELWPVPVALVLALVGWIGSAVVYSIGIGIQEGARQATTRPSGGEMDVAAVIGPESFAFLAAVPPLVGLFFAVVFLLLVRPAAVRWIGFNPGRVPWGLALAVLAAVFAVPATIFVGGLTELTYQAVDYQHPPEHELLKFMKEAPAAWIQWTAIAAAVLVAPLFEEVLFRGLIQTSLVSWFTRWGRQPVLAMPPAIMPGEPLQAPTNDGWQHETPVPPPATPWLPPPVDPAAPPAGPSQPMHAGVTLPGLQATPGPQTPQARLAAIPYMPVPVPLTFPPPTDRRRRWATWLGILITSVIFAVIHPLWTAPIIFFLALILGYLYERTGNLWVSIFVHAIFNATSTVLYLMGVGGN